MAYQFILGPKKKRQKKLRDSGLGSGMYNPVPPLLVIHVAPTCNLTAICYKTKVLMFAIPGVSGAFSISVLSLST